MKRCFEGFVVSTNTPQYSMSFTTGALLSRPCVIMAELFAEIGDWNQVRATVLTENRLQMRTVNASRRICREIIARLKQLTLAELAIVRNGSQHEQNHILWLAACKRYRFIYDFAVEVVREKFLGLDFKLAYDDYDIFFNGKAEWHPEVRRVAPATRRKQRQLLFKMMAEAELLSGDRQIMPALLSVSVVDAIRNDNPAHFAVFPVTELDVKQWTQ